MGTKLAVRAADWLIKQVEASKMPDNTIFCDTPETAVLLGLVKRQYLFTPVQNLRADTDFK